MYFVILFFAELEEYLKVLNINIEILLWTEVN